MCASCGCGCKKGSPEKGCKCDCKTCANAREGAKHESSESKSYEGKEKEVEKAFKDASDILKAYTNSQLKRKRNIGLGAAGVGALGVAAGRPMVDMVRARTLQSVMTPDAAKQAKYIKSAVRYAHGATGLGLGGAAIVAGGLAQAGKSQIRLSHRNRKMDVTKAAFFAEDVEKGMPNIAAMGGQLKALGGALKTGAKAFVSGAKTGEKFGSAGVKNAVSPYGVANAAQKVKTAGFKTGNAYGAGKKYAMANPGKTAAMGAGAGVVGYGATKINKSAVSAFGVEH